MLRQTLTDGQFALLAPLLPAERPPRRGRPFLPHRRVLEGIFWILRTGAPWRDLPTEFGNWSGVYERFRRWRRNGLWQKILDLLQARARRGGRIDFEFSAVDGSTVRAHRCAAGALKKGLQRKQASNNKPWAAVAAGSRRRST